MAEPVAAEPAAAAEEDDGFGDFDAAPPAPAPASHQRPLPKEKLASGGRVAPRTFFRCALTIYDTLSTVIVHLEGNYSS